MFTRGMVRHDYTPFMPAPVNVPGSIQLRQAGLGTQGNVEAAMPISRPNSSPNPGSGAPFYASGSYQYRANALQRGGTMALTPTERRVARIAAAGVPNRQIAQSLFVTEKTVETHLASVYRKLGIRARGQLAGALSA